MTDGTRRAAGWRHRLRRVGGYSFAAWVYLVALAIVPTAWLLAILLPRRPAWTALHHAARALFFCATIPFTVRGLEHLDRDPGLLVANHTSFLDVVALIAALPRPIRFVAKAELRRHWPVRVLLRRLRTEFVERFDRKKSLDDFRRIAARAREGEPFLFFPEGTFRRAPGLMPFRMGAFLAAADAVLPITPVALRGTRIALRSESWLPRRAPITVTITPSIRPDPALSPRQRASRLRDLSRAAILEHCGEPDRRDTPSPLDLALRDAGAGDGAPEPRR